MLKENADGTEAPPSRYSVMKSRRHELNDMIKDYRNDERKDNVFHSPIDRNHNKSVLNVREFQNSQNYLSSDNGKQSDKCEI